MKSITYRPQKLNPLAKHMIMNPAITVIVTHFLGVDWHKETKVFPNFVVYKSPKDFPGKFVVRLFDGIRPLRLITTSNTLEEARKTIPDIFFRTPRSKNDDPVIVEVWI